jgi:hypothetical protein
MTSLDCVPRAGHDSDVTRPRDAIVDASRRGRDLGTSLVEVVIAITLMGLAVSVMIVGIRALVMSSTTSEDQAKAESVLTSAADLLTNAPYEACPGVDAALYAPIVQAAVGSVGDWNGAVVEVAEIRFWNPPPAEAAGSVIDADGDWSESNTVVGAECDAEFSTLRTRVLQRVTIRVTSPDGGLSRTREIIKSDINGNTSIGVSP